MKCTNCGTAVEADERFCWNCGATVDAYAPNAVGKKPKGKKKRIIALILGLLIILAAIPAGWLLGSKLFNPAQPAAYAADDVYVEIGEKYTDKKITDGESAIDSLTDVAELLGITDVEGEFTVQSATSFAGSNYYRVAQSYKGIPVYGRDIVVIADDNGVSEGLTSNYFSAGDQVDTTPRISEDEAGAVAFDYLLNSQNATKESMEITIVGLVIIDASTRGELVLAWEVGVRGVTESKELFDVIVFINSKSAQVIKTESKLSGVMAPITLQGQKVRQSIVVDKENNTYHLRNHTMEQIKQNKVQLPISVWQVKKGYENKWLEDYPDNLEEISWQEGEEIKASAVDAFANVTAAVAYYNDVLNRNSWDNKGSPTFAFVGLKYYEYDEALDIGYYRTVLQATGGGGHIYFYKPLNLPVIGQNTDEEYSAYLDITAHEFTHSVVETTAGFSQGVEAKALSEAYGDIMGECVKNYWQERSADWVFGNGSHTERDLTKAVSMADFINDNKDETMYKNATIISHVAYLMWNGGENGQWTPIRDEDDRAGAKKLAKIWYGSLLSMHSDATFTQCRNAVELSARRMMRNGEVTAEEFDTVINAFGAVDVDKTAVQYNKIVDNNIDLIVYGTGKDPSDSNILTYEPADSYYLEIEKIEFPWPRDEGGASSAREFINDSPHKMYLENGSYKLTVSDAGGTGTSESIKIKVVGMKENIEGMLEPIDHIAPNVLDVEIPSSLVEMYTDFKSESLVVIIKPRLDNGFEGDWYDSQGGRIRISNLQESSFDFAAILLHRGVDMFAPNVGELKGTATVLNNQTAIMTHRSDWLGETGETAITFELAGDTLIVKVDLPNNNYGEYMWLGFGYNVSISGEYSKEAPSQGSSPPDNKEDWTKENKNEASFELTDYIGKDIHAVAKEIAVMYDVGVTDGIEYRNEEIIIVASNDDNRIHWISLEKPCDYRIFGIQINSMAQPAITKLENAGWLLIGEYAGEEGFCKIFSNSGQEIYIYSDSNSGNSNITRISYTASKNFVVEFERKQN